MNKLLLPILLVFTLPLVAQTPCSGGSAGPYPCNGYNLQSQFDLTTLNAGSGNDSWGWTDPATGKEYALVGLSNGTAFIDISNPTNPTYLGKLPTHTSSSSWRDIKTYNNHAFIVSEANGHGMQVFDLTRLRNVPSPPQTFTEDAHFGLFGSAHNIVINEETGYAYPVGTGLFNGGPIFVNIQNPTNPVSEGGYGTDDYSHDAQVVTYCGPDKDYSGRELLIGSNENEVVIVDITDKSNPVNISSISYSNVGYTHQGWFTEDERFFILGDETDELGAGFNTRTIIFDFEDLDNPSLHFEYSGPTPAIDHNGYVKGTKYYMANYRAGLRVINVEDIANQNIFEEGYFDSYPNNNNASFSGAWSVYPYFESGNIVISDINRGFLLVKAQNPDLTAPTAICQNITVSLDSDGQAVITASQIDNGSSDNSGVVYLEICDETFNCGDLGPNSVQLEVYDDFGNKDFCIATVTVVDDMAPQTNCPADSSVEYDSGAGFFTLPDYIANGSVTANDNCSANPSISQTPVAGTQLTAGTYTINFNAEDGNGNTGNCSFQLTVVEILASDDETLASGLVIYPNPARDIINIASETVPLRTVDVFDITGKLVLGMKLDNNLQSAVDVSALSKGVYFMNINGAVVEKILIE